MNTTLSEQLTSRRQQREAERRNRIRAYRKEILDLVTKSTTTALTDDELDALNRACAVTGVQPAALDGLAQHVRGARALLGMADAAEGCDRLDEAVLAKLSPAQRGGLVDHANAINAFVGR